MLVDKTVVGDDLKCSLTKTWAKATIKSAETQATKWGFGDARCSVHPQHRPGPSSPPPSRNQNTG
jgi:hypothetical protein